jgi:hypothetical protein
MRWEAYVACMGRRGIHTEFWWKAKMKKTTWKIILKWMDLKEIRWTVNVWIHLVQGREQWRALLKMVINFRVP